MMFSAWLLKSRTGSLTVQLCRFFYYRVARDLFEAGARYLRTDTYTEEEYKVHRPDLPFAFAQYDSLSWYTQQPDSEPELERQLADARVHKQKRAVCVRLAAPGKQRWSAHSFRKCLSHWYPHKVGVFAGPLGDRDRFSAVFDGPEKLRVVPEVLFDIFPGE
jgi:hypothetical protein